MRVATWNVNSVRQRLTPLLAFLRDTAPDVLCLQETKCEDHAFPRLEIDRPFSAGIGAQYASLSSGKEFATCLGSWCGG